MGEGTGGGLGGEDGVGWKEVKLFGTGEREGGKEEDEGGLTA